MADATLTAVPAPTMAPKINTKSTTVPVDSVSIVVAYKTKDGKIEEVVQTVDSADFIIGKVVHSVEEKQKALKDEEGDMIGFEPTGEYLLNLQVRYFKP